MCGSDAPRPPGLLRATLILTRVGLRRRLARMGHMLSRRKRGGAGASRGPTLRKRPGGGCLLVFFGAIMLWNAGFLSWQFLGRMDEETVRLERGAIVEAALRGDLGWPTDAVQQLAEGLKNSPEADPDSSPAVRQIVERNDWVARHIQAHDGPAVTAIRHRVRCRGDAGVALLALGLLLAVFLSQLGARNQDLGKVEWSFAWLFTFPVSTRAIFLSKILEYSIGDFLSWCIFAPFLFVVGLWAGAGFAALPLALVGAFYLNLILAAVQIGIETWLRMRLGPSRLKNFQGAFTLLGILCLMGAMGLALAPAGPGLLLSAVQAVGTWPGWTPAAWPIRVTGGDAAALVAAATMAASTLILVAGSLAWVTRQVRGGLDAQVGAFRGARGKRAGRIAPRKSRFRGVIGKDLKLLWRDRNLFVQTLVVPAVIVGFQIVINPGLVAQLGGNFDHIPAFAFGLGAYILMFSAVQSLAVEGNALWLLLTAPVRLERVIFGKAMLWGTFAAVLPTALMVWAAMRAPALTVGHAVGAALALAGLFVYAVIAAGMGALATDVLEQDVRRRIRPATLYLFMLLAVLYAWALYAPGLWQRFGMLVLCAGLAFSVWQKFKDNAPYLLDPEARPPKRIGLAHGMVATIVFFMVQGVATVLFAAAGDMDPSAAFLGGYVIAGIVLLVGVIMFVTLTDREIEPSTRGTPPTGWIRSLGAGVVCGIAAAVVGGVWLLITELVEPLRVVRDSVVMFDVADAGNRIRALLLGVVAAPLVEEFLFRRLIYRSLRRALPVGVAAAASAVMFAVVHHPISMAPVFVMGVVAALVYERTGRLVAPIVAHAVYNALVIGASIWQA